MYYVLCMWPLYSSPFAEQHNYVNSIILVILWLLFSHKIPYTNDCLFLSYFDAVIMRRFEFCALSSSPQTVRSGYFSLFTVQVKKKRLFSNCQRLVFSHKGPQLLRLSFFLLAIQFTAFCVHEHRDSVLSACIFLWISGLGIVCKKYFNNLAKLSIILWRSKCLLSQLIGDQIAGQNDVNENNFFQKQTWQSRVRCQIYFIMLLHGCHFA